MRKILLAALIALLPVAASAQNITSVTLSNGVPTAGTGNVSTLDNLIGTAGSPNTNVQTIQGISSMTPILVQQSGTWSVGLTGTLPAFAATPTFNIGTLNGAATAANQAAVQGTAAPGTAASNSSLIGGIYSSTPPTLTNGQQAAVRLDASGAQNVHVTAIDNQNANIGTNADSVAPAASSVAPVGSFNFGYDGTNWDRVRVDTVGHLQIVQMATAQGGTSHYHRVSAASTNADVILGTHTLYSVQTGNISGSQVAYLKFYDKATAPVCNSDPVVKTVVIPANSLGGGNNVNFGSTGAAFTNGIGICITAGMPDTDNTAVAANVVTVNFEYK